MLVINKKIILRFAVTFTGHNLYITVAVVTI
jgi:hypothetical protein